MPLSSWPHISYSDSLDSIGKAVMQTTMTNKGQVTIPKPIRDKLHLEPGDRIDISLEEAVCGSPPSPLP